jgi:hypothetical protein
MPIYVQVYDRTFTAEEIVRGLLGLGLSREQRALCREITEKREEGTRKNLPPPRGGDPWHELNMDHGGSPERAAIPTRAELWKVFDEEGAKGVLRRLPMSRGKYPDAVLVQLALWEGCLDEVDMEGFIAMGLTVDEIIETVEKLRAEGHPVGYQVVERSATLGIRSVKVFYQPAR